MKNVVSIILVVLVLGFGVYYFLSSNTTTDALVADDNAVLLADQKPGNDVVVSYAKLAKPGYVLVHTTDTTTNQKVLVGSSELLSVGEHKNVKVPRRGGGSSGSRISASIVADDGNGTLDEAEINADPVVEGEATFDLEAEDVSNLTDEEITELLEEAGYDVVDLEAEEEVEEVEETATTTEDDSTATGTEDVMTDDSTDESVTNENTEENL